MFIKGNPSTAREASNNQVNIMTCVVVISLFTQQSPCLSNWPLNKVAIVAGIGDMHGLKSMNVPLLRAAMDTISAGCS